jgi:hypothetical protein
MAWFPRKTVSSNYQTGYRFGTHRAPLSPLQEQILIFTAKTLQVLRPIPLVREAAELISSHVLCELMDRS